MSNKKPNPLLQRVGQSFEDVSAPPNLGGMPKKHFEDKVENEIKKEVDVAVKKEVKQEVDVDSELDFSSVIDRVPNFNKPPKKRQVTVYIDEDIAKKLDKLGKEKGKGAKSELANMLFKNALKGY